MRGKGARALSPKDFMLRDPVEAAQEKVQAFFSWGDRLKETGKA